MFGLFCGMFADFFFFNDFLFLKNVCFASILNALRDSDIVTWSTMDRVACQARYTRSLRVSTTDD